ncbi:MAG: cysteine desulfurase [Prevotella sp.]|nr:cysteine desulfurase [Prevotella sp.]
MFNVDIIRGDFPILQREVHGRKLVYLDNAATTQKPLAVLDAMRSEYLNVNANVHRGVHYLSQQATELHEAARERVRSFLNARKTEEIIFTRGTTEAINLVASTFCMSQMKAGDEVLVTDMEHHSNIVPWQMQALQRGIVVRHLPITDEGELRMDLLDEYLTERTRLVSLCHVSNVLGTVNPVAEVVARAHALGIPVLVDAAQSAPHMAIDVQQMGCDFLALSGHKMYGPTGVGVLYGREEWLDRLPPYQGGGEMISNVSWEKTTYNELPFKFEAGTPDYVATHGLATAIDYITALGLDNIHAHEQGLLSRCTEQLSQIDGLRILKGEAPPSSPEGDTIDFCPTKLSCPPRGAKGGLGEASGVLSFVVEGTHPLDIGTLLDQLGIAVRTGHHCAQPLVERLGLTSTVRASFALYNTVEEVDALTAALHRVIPMLS